MDKRAEIERCREDAKKIMEALSRVLGEMDAEQDWYKHQRKMFTISGGPRGETKKD